MSDEELLARYRKRETEIEGWIKEVGECPHCGWSGHQDECCLAPVEVCGKPVYDQYNTDALDSDEEAYYPCPRRDGHDGDCE